MRLISSLVLLGGAIALSLARPEAGYSYPQQLSQSQASASYQPAAQQQVILNQNPQTSSYQQNLPQLTSLPIAPAPAISQASSYQENLPQLTISPAQLPSYQQNLPQSIAPAQFSSYQQNLPQSIAPAQFVSYQQNLPQSIAPAQLPSYQQNLPQLPISQSFSPSSYQPQQAVNLIQTQQDLSQIVEQPPPQQITLNQASQSLAYQQTIGEPTRLPETPQLLNGGGQYHQLAAQQQLPIITKHVYVHVAPEEPQLSPSVIPAPAPPKKSYKIIFIKAPSQAASQRQVIHVPASQPAVEEKTLVYVLVDRPQQPQIVVPTPAPASISKPEVYFIKYKANAAPAPATDVASSLPAAAIEDVNRAQNQPEPISSGESSSSLFSGGLSTQYGPPGYQKRSA